MNIILGLVYISILIGGIIGWIMNLINIIQLAQLDGPMSLTLMLGLQLIGIIFVPLGAIVGWIV